MRRTQPRRCALALTAALWALACAGEPSFQEPTTTNQPRKNVMVQFTDASLHPSEARVLRGGSVVWINYSMSYDGSVVFPESIREHFTCSDLRPLFMKVADGYQSIPIREASEDVTLPCALEPGEYSYELRLFARDQMAVGGDSSMDNPQLTLPGRIVVE